MLRARDGWEEERRCVSLPDRICRCDNPTTTVLSVLDNNGIFRMSRLGSGGGVCRCRRAAGRNTRYRLGVRCVVGFRILFACPDSFRGAQRWRCHRMSCACGRWWYPESKNAFPRYKLLGLA